MSHLSEDDVRQGDQGQRQDVPQGVRDVHVLQECSEGEDLETPRQFVLFRGVHEEGAASLWKMPEADFVSVLEFVWQELAP